jgi:hypothetical protein
MAVVELSKLLTPMERLCVVEVERGAHLWDDMHSSRSCQMKTRNFSSRKPHRAPNDDDLPDDMHSSMSSQMITRNCSPRKSRRALNDDESNILSKIPWVISHLSSAEGGGNQNSGGSMHRDQ